MTKNGGKRRKRNFRTFDPSNGGLSEHLILADDSDSQSNSSYDGNTSDDSYPINSGAHSNTTSSGQGRSRANSMNVNAVSFSPNFEPRLTATAASFQPNSNPYSHAESSSINGMIEITPTKVSPEDIYEYQRMPSGVVITTRGGQQVEFWERVHVPDSQKQYSQHAWHDRSHW